MLNNYQDYNNSHNKFQIVHSILIILLILVISRWYKCNSTLEYILYFHTIVLHHTSYYICVPIVLMCVQGIKKTRFGTEVIFFYVNEQLRYKSRSGLLTSAATKMLFAIIKMILSLICLWFHWLSLPFQPKHNYVALQW